MMADYFVEEIRAFATGRLIRDWLPCNGQLLQPRQYNTLFGLIEFTYGGDVNRGFALPDLRGRTMCHPSTRHPRGHPFGKFTVALTAEHFPPHRHRVRVATELSDGTREANTPLVQHAFLAGKPRIPQAPGEDIQPFVKSDQLTGLLPLDPATVDMAGQGLPHSNMMPYLPLQLCICVNGLFPPRL